MEAVRDSFVFYRSFAEAIEELPDDLQLECYKAITNYALYGEETANSPYIKALFKSFRANIDAAQKKRDANIENGKKGGRPRLKKPNQTTMETQHNLEKPKEKLTKPNHNLNVNVNVNDNVNDNDKDTLVKTPVKKNTQKQEQEVKEIIDYWNKNTVPPLPKVSKITDSRKKAIIARIKENSKSAVLNMIDTAISSDFLSGRKTDWKADFDWLMKPANFVKVIEGNYNNLETVPKNMQGALKNLEKQMLEEAQNGGDLF